MLQNSPGLSRIEAYYVHLVEEECQSLISGVNLNGHLFADVQFLGGIQVSLDGMFDDTAFFKLDKLEDYGTALERLSKVPASFEGAIETLKEGIDMRVTYANESLSRVYDQFENVLKKDPAESGFFGPFKNMDKEKYNELLTEAIQDKAKKIIRDKIMPAIAKLCVFMQTEYSKHLRSVPGVSNIPQGQRYYQQALEFHTTLNGMSPLEVHKIGLQEVKELKRGVMKVAEELGYPNMAFKDFVAMVKEDPKQMFSTKEEVLAYVRDIVFNKINPKLDQVIPEELLNDRLYSLSVEASSPGNQAFARYSSGNKEGTENGTYYLNANNPKVQYISLMQSH